MMAAVTHSNTMPAWLVRAQLEYSPRRVAIARARESLKRMGRLVDLYEQGLTGRELAAGLGVSQRTVRYWLRDLGLHRLRRERA